MSKGSSLNSPSLSSPLIQSQATQPLSMSTISTIQSVLEWIGWHDMSQEIADKQRDVSIEQRNLLIASSAYEKNPSQENSQKVLTAIAKEITRIEAMRDDMLRLAKQTQKQLKKEQDATETAAVKAKPVMSYWESFTTRVKTFFELTPIQRLTEEIEKYQESARNREKELAALRSCWEKFQAEAAQSITISEEIREEALSVPGQHLLQTVAASVSDASPVDATVTAVVPRLKTSVTLTRRQFPAVMTLRSSDSQVGFAIDGEPVEGESGYSVASAGDINGDGVDDLVIGAPYYNSNIGRIYVLFGGSWMDSIDTLALSSLNGTDGFKLEGEPFESGYSVASAGDINDDGIDDLLIGAPGYNGHIGRTYAVFGGAGVGLTGILALNSLNGVNGFKLDGEPNSYSLSGYSVASAGDINGDGVDDLVIGAPDYNLQTGRSYVVFGGAGVGSTGILALSSLNGTNGFKLNGDVHSMSGNSVASAGDINGDGVDDLLIGDAPLYDYMVGQTYVVFGGAGVGSTEILHLSSLNGVSGFWLIGEAVGDFSGFSVSGAGDVNGDGYADILIGAFAYPGTGMIGRSYVVFGGPRIGSTGNLALKSLNGANGFKLDGEGGGSGYSVASAGDINGDGFGDLLIGAPFWGSGLEERGRTYVVFGGPGISSPEPFALSSLNGINGFKLDGEASRDNYGYSVSSAGDINGDKMMDLVIGAPGYNNDAGRSYINIISGPFSETGTPPWLFWVAGSAAAVLALLGIVTGYYCYRKRSVVAEPTPATRLLPESQKVLHLQSENPTGLFAGGSSSSSGTASSKQLIMS